MWSLEGEVKIDDELMICLLENVSLDDCVFELFLKDQIFFLKCLKRIEATIDVELGQEDLSECTRAESVDDREGREVDFGSGDLIELGCQLSCCLFFSVQLRFFLWMIRSWLVYSWAIAGALMGFMVVF